MSDVAVRQVGPRDRLALLGLIGRPGSAMLEGWNDERGLTIVLPWPEEIRETAWSRLDDAASMLRSVLSVADSGSAPVDLPFAGGWIGFVTYEVGAAWEDAPPREDLPDEPAVWFARHSSGVVQLADGRTFVFGPEAEIDSRCAVVRDVVAGKVETQRARGVTFSDSLANGAYQAAVEGIRERISWGEVYQVNLTRRLMVEDEIDPVALYVGMTGDDPPRCSALIHGDGWSIASASPEVFLRFDRVEGIADSRPIKGTIRRTSDDGVDRTNLLGSEKDEAEHLMIVDLVRNDIGKVAPVGNVRVAEYKSLRTLAHVLHLESIVEARGLDLDDLYPLFRALFPAGSITGAPKRAAVHAIREIEPCARGVYTGTIGFIDDRGHAEMSVAIRTAVIGKGGCRYHAGGGIVWDSDPEAEDRESFAKSIGFLETLGLDIE